MIDRFSFYLNFQVLTDCVSVGAAPGSHPNFDVSKFLRDNHETKSFSRSRRNN